MRSIWLKWAKVAAWFALPWTALTILWALQWGPQLSPNGRIDWPRIFALSALNWYSSALVSIPLTYLVWQRALQRAPLYRSLLFYALAVAAASVTRFFIFVPLHNRLFGSSYQLADQLRSNFPAQFVGLVTVVAVVLAIRYAQYANELTAARLEALQAQLQPHFLFNTLHAVSTLMHRDVEGADEMLARLCDLLRTTLQQPAKTEIALAEELVLLEEYLQIMERRFPGRLRLKIDVPPEVRDARVPPLLLQPLVENVLRHGLDESALTEIRVAVEVTKGMLKLSVVDDGRGLVPGEPVRTGIGLENTRRRIEAFYGKRATLSIACAVPAGTEVSLVIPYATSA